MAWWPVGQWGACWPKKVVRCIPTSTKPTSLTLPIWHHLHPTQHFYYPLQFSLTNTLCHQQKGIKLCGLQSTPEYSRALQSSQSLIIFCWCKWNSWSLFKYWTALQVSSPQKGHRTGTDSLLCESEPGGFTEVCASPSSISVLTVTQPLSLPEWYKGMENHLLDALDLLCSQQSHLNSDWLTKFNDSSNQQIKFVSDNICDKTCHTLLKTNEQDWHDQPLPANDIGHHFRSFKHNDYAAQ